MDDKQAIEIVLNAAKAHLRMEEMGLIGGSQPRVERLEEAATHVTSMLEMMRVGL